MKNAYPEILSNECMSKFYRSRLLFIFYRLGKDNKKNYIMLWKFHVAQLSTTRKDLTLCLIFLFSCSCMFFYVPRFHSTCTNFIFFLVTLTFSIFSLRWFSRNKQTRCLLHLTTTRYAMVFEHLSFFSMHIKFQSKHFYIHGWC